MAISYLVDVYMYVNYMCMWNYSYILQTWWITSITYYVHISHNTYCMLRTACYTLQSQYVLRAHLILYNIHVLAHYAWQAFSIRTILLGAYIVYTTHSILPLTYYHVIHYISYYKCIFICLCEVKCMSPLGAGIVFINFGDPNQERSGTIMQNKKNRFTTKNLMFRDHHNIGSPPVFSHGFSNWGTNNSYICYDWTAHPARPGSHWTPRTWRRSEASEPRTQARLPSSANKGSARMTYSRPRTSHCDTGTTHCGHCDTRTLDLRSLKKWSQCMENWRICLRVKILRTQIYSQFSLWDSSTLFQSISPSNCWCPALDRREANLTRSRRHWMLKRAILSHEVKTQGSKIKMCAALRMKCTFWG